MLRLVAATRSDATAFPQTPLGRSLERMRHWQNVRAEIAFNNSAGLPDVYNAAIQRADDRDSITFIHDDVWIDDWFLPLRVEMGLSQFAVLGVAGNVRRVPRQPSWYFVDADLTRDDPRNYSGAVAHGPNGMGTVNAYGPTPRPVALLDGLFLAAKVSTLRTSGVTFDPRFRFHFYDVDFCRSCERAGLAMGTWPIDLTHASGGNFQSPEWIAASQVYFEKWRE
jgi:hypothetical protein